MVIVIQVLETQWNVNQGILLVGNVLKMEIVQLEIVPVTVWASMHR